MVLALIVAGVFPAASIYVWQAQLKEFTGEDAIEIAVHFLRNSPTFKFDGIPESVNVIDTKILESFPVQYVITITFDSRHAGYGDRKDMMLAQVITPHEIVITIVEGKVIRAVIDDQWDELNQREVVQGELLPPEFAKDLVIKHILENHPELGTIPLPEVWAFEILTPEGLVGASIKQFIGDGWTVNVSYPVVQFPEYTVEIEYKDGISFHWKGTVDQSGNVDEMNFTVVR